MAVHIHVGRRAGKIAARDSMNMSGLNFGAVKSELSGLGIEIKKNDEWEEFVVNFKGGREATSYHTDDLRDALNTGKAMARKGK